MMQDDARALLAALDTDDWSAVREAVEQAGDVLRTQQVDDALRAGVASRLLHLSVAWQSLDRRTSSAFRSRRNENPSSRYLKQLPRLAHQVPELRA